MTTLILARHGNTFEKGEKAVWVGARTDMPLTHEGEAQAERLIVDIKEKFPPLSSVTAGPLRRTRRAAEIMSAGDDFALDARLTEIDYGTWEGKSNEEIAALYGPEVLKKWDEESLCPADMGWMPSEGELIQRLTALLNDYKARSGVHVAVTSNGLLRLVRRIVTGETSAAKVRTGAYCVLENADDAWRVAAWDVRP